MEKNGFLMKDCWSASALGWKIFISMRDQNDEPIFTYNDKYKRYFVRQSIKGGPVCSFNQYYRSKTCDEVLKTSSEELNKKRDVDDIFEAYRKCKNHHLENN